MAPTDPTHPRAPLGNLMNFARCEAFWSKVDLLGHPNGCWEWQAYRDRGGYGVFGAGKRAHRISWEESNGSIPEGLVIDHLCENPPCVNPEHLTPTTHRENVLRGTKSASALNRRKTHCPQGHPYDETNTRLTPDGRRACRACHRAFHHIYKERRRGQA